MPLLPFSFGSRFLLAPLSAGGSYGDSSDVQLGQRVALMAMVEKQ